MANEKETTRVGAFSDGVFAIAITLLILEIKVSKIDIHMTNSQLFTSLVNLWPSYFAFLLSFMAVLIMWINHHGFFVCLLSFIISFFYAISGLFICILFRVFRIVPDYNKIGRKTARKLYI